MVNRSGCTCYKKRLIEKKLCNIKLLYQKAKTLDEEMESKLVKGVKEIGFK